MQDKVGVYQIRNILDNKIYIGSTINLRKRKNRHFSMLKLNNHYNIHLQRAYNKYGKENFVFETLITCHKAVLVWYEQQFVDKWKPDYNIREKVDTNLRVKRTSKFKKNVGNFFRGRPISEKHKRNISLSNLKKPYFNKTGFRGVYPHPSKKGAFISRFRGQHLGCYATAEEAHSIYLNARNTWLAEGG